MTGRLRAWIPAATLALAAGAATALPVSVTITKVRCVDDCDEAGLEALFESTADFYAKVWIDGAETRTPREPDDKTEAAPFWVVSRTVPDGQPTVAVGIQLWDHDSTSGDDLGDASPLGGGDNNLDIVVDAATGRWTGDVAWPQSCAAGGGGDEPRVEVCFDVSVSSLSGDLDGDGLLDGWERNGLDANGDGVIDVDLPGMGALVVRRDLFVELDSEAGSQPTRAAIRSIKAAFAAAPLGNPDGSTGISLWIDAGATVDLTSNETTPAADCQDGVDNDADTAIDGADPQCTGGVGATGAGGRPYLDTASEAAPPAAPPTPFCLDGADNDGDGSADAADPDCLVGDNLGGGGTIPAMGACNLDAAFFASKLLQFNALRAPAFRYGVSAAQGGGCTATGGQGVGVNFVDFNNDGGTIMHEIGHSLGLQHGGTDGVNCKPNYVSVMNYDRQFGITRALGGAILDFSPPRLALGTGARAAAPLLALNEAALNEALPVDPGDGVNEYLFSTGVNVVVPRTANAAPNWANDGPPLLPSVAANVNQGRSPLCDNTMVNETLAGAVDWTAIQFSPRAVGGGGDQPVPLDQPEPTLDELRQLAAEINATDLTVVIADGPDPAAAGATFALTLSVANNGPVAATSVALTAALPPQAVWSGAPPQCALAGASLACNFGRVEPGGTVAVGLTALTPPDLVYVAGAPVTLTATAETRNLNGPETAPADNAATQTTVVRAEADLSATALAVPNPPVAALVGESFVVAVDTTLGGAGGPSSPMDAALELEAEASPGATVSPTRLTTAQPRVVIGEARAVKDYLIVRCDRPGGHVVRVRHAVRPMRGPDVNLIAANDADGTGFAFTCEGGREVTINVWPGRFPNVLALRSREAPVAIMTTAEGEYGRPAFDAVDVDPASVAVGPEEMLADPALGRPVEPGREEPSDEPEPVAPEQTRDGDADLRVWFDPSASAFRPESRRLCVTGLYRDPGGALRPFFGCDEAVVEE